MPLRLVVHQSSDGYSSKERELIRKILEKDGLAQSFSTADKEVKINVFERLYSEYRHLGTFSRKGM